MTDLRFAPVDPVEPMDNRSRVARCVGKERFVSAVLAHQVASRSAASKKRRDRLKGRLKVYLCCDCGGWHIGGVR